jgi:hypothetical protein
MGCVNPESPRRCVAGRYHDPRSTSQSIVVDHARVARAKANQENYCTSLIHCPSHFRRPSRPPNRHHPNPHPCHFPLLEIVPHLEMQVRVVEEYE